MWFYKFYNLQQCLITMIEKWRENLDKDGAPGSLLTDLSEDFDYFPHELLIDTL